VIATAPKLIQAGQEFAKLAEAQRNHFLEKRKTNKKDYNIDSAEKAYNYAIVSAWSFAAGMLHENKPRLARHYALSSAKGTDPLNAPALAKGRHKSDPENYRGLGHRTDAKERGRLVELFFLQAEKGDGISKAIVDAAILKFHAKQATLEARAAEAKL
jgi:hypothetical protein